MVDLAMRQTFGVLFTFRRCLKLHDLFFLFIQEMYTRTQLSIIGKFLHSNYSTNKDRIELYLDIVHCTSVQAIVGKWLRDTLAPRLEN